MIPTDFVQKIADETGISDLQLVEKDLYLQGLLLELAKSTYFEENFAFKGGTCLTKAYFGYYRFSEDLDFTWMNQKAFENKSEKQVRKILSKEISALLEIIESAAKKLGLGFNSSKSNKKYVELGGSNKFATFKLWYRPATASSETFIKLQFNFVEKIFHQPKTCKIKAIAPKHEKELELEYPELFELATGSPQLWVYDLREIAAEKIRALLTRRGFKARDLADLYVLSKNGITISSVKTEAVEKTIFMLKYLKYAENLAHKKFAETTSPEDEQKIFLAPRGDGFKKFADQTLAQLNELAEQVRKKAKTAKNRGPAKSLKA